jgi:3-oxoacyl-(acyl-carrier-protein) reductase
MSRVALVTGGSRGIGRATALALAAHGHRVALTYSANREAAEKLAAEVGGLAVAMNVTDAASIDTAFAAVENSYGRVEVLVNNAGITNDGLALRMPAGQWQDVIDANLTGAFAVIQRALPGMVRQRHGRIVNVGSTAGLSGSAGQVNYAAAKAGLVGLTRSLARELATRNVTCNVVAPGPIATDMTAALGDERQAHLSQQVPMGRMGTPEEVAAVIAFLCSDAAAYVTGAVVPVDGGLGMGH